MAEYRCNVPFIDDMGSISKFRVSSSPSETKEEYALWHINSMRDHDGLKHLTKLPKGTTFERVDNG